MAKQMRSAKFIAIFIAAILVLLPSLAHAQAPFRGMKLLTQNTGWAAAVYATADGGRTWRPALSLVGAPGSIGSVLPAAIAGSTVVFPGQKKGGHLRLSAFPLAGSAKLITGAFPAQFLLQSASFISPGRGWVLSFGGLPLYGTSDGGATWTDITPGPHVPRISRHAAR